MRHEYFRFHFEEVDLEAVALCDFKALVQKLGLHPEVAATIYNMSHVRSYLEEHGVAFKETSFILKLRRAIRPTFACVTQSPKGDTIECVHYICHKRRGSSLSRVQVSHICAKSLVVSFRIAGARIGSCALSRLQLQLLREF